MRFTHANHPHITSCPTGQLFQERPTHQLLFRTLNVNMFMSWLYVEMLLSRINFLFTMLWIITSVSCNHKLVSVCQRGRETKEENEKLECNYAG